MQAGKFSLSTIKEELEDFLKTKISQVEYISPGHGLRGKLQSLSTEKDLVTMYSVYKGKKGNSPVVLSSRSRNAVTCNENQTTLTSKFRCT